MIEFVGMDIQKKLTKCYNEIGLMCSKHVNQYITNLGSMI